MFPKRYKLYILRNDTNSHIYIPHKSHDIRQKMGNFKLTGSYNKAHTQVEKFLK